MKAFLMILTILTLGSELALAQRYPGPHRPGPRPAQNTCRCEDRNYDGSYGIVRYSPYDRFDTGLILGSNLGSYQSCERLRVGHNSCRARAQAIFACEDQDGDGRFGVVQYDRNSRNGRVFYGNYGTLHQCVRYASRL